MSAWLALMFSIYVIVVIHTQSGNCITTETTVCGDGPVSCVVVTQTECY